MNETGKDSHDRPPPPGAEIEEKAERNRRRLDDAPAPGTDPLHEGP